MTPVPGTESKANLSVELKKNRRRGSATAAHAWKAAGLLDDRLRDSYH